MMVWGAWPLGPGGSEWERGKGPGWRPGEDSAEVRRSRFQPRLFPYRAVKFPICPLPVWASASSSVKQGVGIVLDDLWGRPGSSFWRLWAHKTPRLPVLGMRARPQGHQHWTCSWLFCVEPPGRNERWWQVRVAGEAGGILVPSGQVQTGHRC